MRAALELAGQEDVETIMNFRSTKYKITKFYISLQPKNVAKIKEVNFPAPSSLQKTLLLVI